MSLTSSWITSKRGAVLCALLLGGYQLNKVVEIDGWRQLSVSLRPSEAVQAEVDWYQSAGLGMSFPPTAPLVPATVLASQPPLGEPPRGASSAGGGTGASVASSRRSGEATGGGKSAVVGNLRVGSWALGGFGPEQLRDESLASILASTIRPLDVVALQQVRCAERDFLPRLTALLNRQGGRAYEYMQVPSPGMTGGQLQSVFLFDTNRVVTDRTQLYTVADPDNRFFTKPAVAWFRAADVPPHVAWTFSLVNVSVDLHTARQEVFELPRLMASIGADGRGEDDVIVAGLLQADRSYLQGTLVGKPYWYAAGEQLTDVQGKYQTSNLLLDPRVTSEAVLRGGVIDFLRIHNLSVAEAERVSPHLPVYAEFCPWEGGYR